MFFLIFRLIQHHKADYDKIIAAVSKDKKVERERYTPGNCSIEDLIVLLVAKENMPVRIVESPYFADLLAGKCHTQFTLWFTVKFYSVFSYG